MTADELREEARRLLNKFEQRTREEIRDEILLYRTNFTSDNLFSSQVAKALLKAAEIAMTAKVE